MKAIKQYDLTIKEINSNFPAEKISTAEQAAKFIKQFYKDDIQIFESFFILLLNRQGVTQGYAKISQGGTAGTVVDVKIIAKYAIDSLASSIILAHNHPSGNINPSDADLIITRKVKNALIFLDVIVADHIILTKDSYYSLGDNGHMNY